jgi:curved DNA-binding protein CbpA
MDEQFIDYYNILDLDIESIPEQIRSNYLKLAKKHHPDQGGHPEKFQLICKAYECLYNKESRKNYDLIYLKRSYDEIKEDEFFKYKNDFKQFDISSKKVISEDKLNELMNEVFKDKETFIEKTLDKWEVDKRLNDIALERENQDIESKDPKIKSIIVDNNLEINDIYDYNLFKNNVCNNNIIKSNLGTVDILASDYCNFQVFNSDINYVSNVYSEIDFDDSKVDPENPIFLNKINNNDLKNMNTKEINEIKEWKICKKKDIKLTSNNIEEFLTNRKNEEKFIKEDIDKNLNNIKKKKEINTFLKNNFEEDSEYYDKINNIKKRN